MYFRQKEPSYFTLDSPRLQTQFSHFLVIPPKVNDFLDLLLFLQLTYEVKIKRKPNVHIQREKENLNLTQMILNWYQIINFGEKIFIYGHDSLN